jgi:hypothetical protein
LEPPTVSDVIIGAGVVINAEPGPDTPLVETTTFPAARLLPAAQQSVESPQETEFILKASYDNDCEVHVPDPNAFVLVYNPL